MGEERTVGGEHDGAHTTAAEAVELPVRVGGVHRPVEAGHADGERLVGEPVGEDEACAGLEAQLLRGVLRQRDRHHSAVGRAGAGTGHHRDAALVESGEVGEVGLALAGLRVLEGARQGVRPRAFEPAHRHGQPVEGPLGPADNGLLRRVAALLRDPGGDGQRGGCRVPAAQGVPQRGVTDGAGERGERGEHTGREQHGEEGGGEQQSVRPDTQKYEPRHLSPARTVPLWGPPTHTVSRMLSEHTRSWKPLARGP